MDVFEQGLFYKHNRFGYLSATGDADFCKIGMNRSTLRCQKFKIEQLKENNRQQLEQNQLQNTNTESSGTILGSGTRSGTPSSSGSGSGTPLGSGTGSGSGGGSGSGSTSGGTGSGVATGLGGIGVGSGLIDLGTIDDKKDSNKKLLIYGGIGVGVLLLVVLLVRKNG